MTSKTYKYSAIKTVKTISTVTDVNMTRAEGIMLIISFMLLCTLTIEPFLNLIMGSGGDENGELVLNIYAIIILVVSSIIAIIAAIMSTRHNFIYRTGESSKLNKHMIRVNDNSFTIQTGDNKTNYRFNEAESIEKTDEGYRLTVAGKVIDIPEDGGEVVKLLEYKINSKED